MARQQTDREESDREEVKVAYRDTRNILNLGGSIGVTIPRRALRWISDQDDSDIVGGVCEVTLFSDGTYKVELPTE